MIYIKTFISVATFLAFCLIALYAFLSYKIRKAAASARYSYWGCIVVCACGIIAIALGVGVIPSGHLSIDLGFTQIALVLDEDNNIWSQVTSILALSFVGVVATYLRRQEIKEIQYLAHLKREASREERVEFTSEEIIPGYDTESFETEFEKLPFYERVKRVMENTHNIKYKFEERIDNATSSNSCKIWIANYYEPQIYETATALVACFDSEPVTNQDLKEAVKLFDGLSQKSDLTVGQVLVVLDKDYKLNEDMLEILKEYNPASKIGTISIKACDIQDLIFQMIPWKDYLKCLVNDFETSTIQTFVENAYSPTLSNAYQVPHAYFIKDIGSSRKDRGIEFEEHHIIEQNKIENVDQFIDEWLADISKANLGVLASYGMGKTMFLRYTAFRLAKKILLLKSNQEWMIPIYIPLSGLSPNDLGIKALLESAFSRYSLAASVEAIKILLQLNRAVLLIDAFDEMRAIETSDQRITQIRILQHGIQQGGRMVLTGRPNYFPERWEIDEALPSIGEKWQRFVKIGLAPLSRAKQQAMLDATLPKELFPSTRESIDWALDNDSILQNLASRPVLLDMIRQTFQALDASGHTEFLDARKSSSKTASEVVAGYVDLWLYRQQQKYEQGPAGTKSPHLLSRDHYYKISKDVALRMALLGTPTINAGQIDQIVYGIVVYRGYSAGRRYKARINEETGEQEKTNFELNERLINAIYQQVRTGSLLVLHEGSFTFKFAHKSFQEFFLSKAFTDEIRLFLNHKRQPSWWPETDLFMLIENWKRFFLWTFNRIRWIQESFFEKNTRMTSIFTKDEVKQFILELNKTDTIPQLVKKYRNLKIKQRVFFSVFALIAAQIANNVFLKLDLYLSFVTNPIVIMASLIGYVFLIGATRLKSIERELSGIIGLKPSRPTNIVP